MYFLIFIVVTMIVYVKAFKEDFTEETVAKVSPVLILIGIVTLVLAVLTSIMNKGV